VISGIIHDVNFIPTSIPDVMMIEPQVRGDERGFFMETYQAADFASAGITQSFVQDNHSGSHHGILRGMHYQIHQTQGKLVRVIAGEIFDAVVDLRKSSPFFGNWTGVHLSARNKMQLWVPPGMAHGFYVLSDWAEVVYKTTDFYAPHHERTLLWNDPHVHIDWPIPAGELPQISSKDMLGQPFDQLEFFE
jgi:dTDP-4-dehydrorhamnose 3,5-epimerase